VRLEVILLPDSMHAVMGDAHRLGHGAHAPAAAALGRLRHPSQDLFNLFSCQPGLAATSGRVAEPFQAVPLKPVRPFGNTGYANAHLPGDVLFPPPLRPQQDNAGAQALPLGAGGGMGASVELSSFFRSHIQVRDWSGHAWSINRIQ
jgi:hypothetical protein